MWLPSSLYESLPALYVVVGLLFLSGVAYTGIHSTWGAVYLTLGAFSILSGGVLHLLRKQSRDAKPAPPSSTKSTTGSSVTEERRSS